jgi:hypothetical protein
MYLSEIGWHLYALLFVGCILLPAIVLSVLLYFKPLWLRQSLWLFSFCCLCFLSLSLKFSDNTMLMTDQALELKAGLYQTKIEDIHSAQSKVSVLFCDELGEFKPVVAVNAINLPNYKVGWYRLANQQTAFVMLIGDIEKVTVVSTKHAIALISGDINRDNAGAGLQAKAFR